MFSVLLFQLNLYLNPMMLVLLNVLGDLVLTKTLDKDRLIKRAPHDFPFFFKLIIFDLNFYYNETKLIIETSKLWIMRNKTRSTFLDILKFPLFLMHNNKSNGYLTKTVIILTSPYF